MVSTITPAPELSFPIIVCVFPAPKDINIYNSQQEDQPTETPGDECYCEKEI